MNLRKEIEEFKPFNEQEEVDKEYFLKFNRQVFVQPAYEFVKSGNLMS